MRIGTAQRRARLGVRHLLSERGGSVEKAAEAVVAMHATDPAAARTEAKGPEPMERALYEDRTLVRIFVVPRALAPVVHHSSALAVAVKERKLLTRDFTQSGGFDGEWISRVEG
ncbi:hypothetical protein ACFXJ8_03690 [Nonomuraea sp. NPDC059194]|uniref:hypothetical protein n=1 Tax=Nonomuraea sp. NPDC059194 TaxID=3346764 RepID=UPI0036BF60F0